MMQSQHSKVALSIQYGLVFSLLWVVLLLTTDLPRFFDVNSSEVVDVHPVPSLPSTKLPLMPPKAIKNVMIFFGDGMGISQVDATRIKYYGLASKLHMELMPIVALVRTYAANNLITDSAASATAYATGWKTNNRMVGMTPDGVARRTIMEAARDRGMATGLITTGMLTDATPAAFVTHVPHRHAQSGIALQMITSRVNVMVGNMAYFFPSNDPRSARRDTIDVVKQATRSGYMYVETEEAWQNVEANYVLGHLFDDLQDDESYTETKNRSKTNNGPSLANVTRHAINLLERNPVGFFLLVEEEGIDKGGHKNDYPFVVERVKNLDDAVEVGLTYALQTGNTLVLVLSDHETGGMVLFEEDTLGLKEHNAMGWTTTNHTGQSVPLFAFGPHAENFSGVFDNSDIPVILSRLLELRGVGK
jgi:alkaline phosphatase